MGYRLSVLGINTKDSIIKTHHYYGTKFYGYLRGDETELFSFQYLHEINKIDFETYFGYGSDISIVLNKYQFITFILLYDYDLKHDKEVKHDYELLQDNDIQELMNNDYNIYEISWG